MPLSRAGLRPRAPASVKDLPADKLRGFLGLTGIRLVEHGTRLAVTDSSLG
jgi:hypothetical protein